PGADDGGLSRGDLVFRHDRRPHRAACAGAPHRRPANQGVDVRGKTPGGELTDFGVRRESPLWFFFFFAGPVQGPGPAGATKSKKKTKAAILAALQMVAYPSFFRPYALILRSSVERSILRMLAAWLLFQ